MCGGHGIGVVKKALSSHGIKKFESGEMYTLTVPEDERKHEAWLYDQWTRLNELIEEENPKPEDKRQLPDSAFGG